MTRALSDFLGTEVPPLTEYQAVCQNVRPVGNATFLLRLPGGQEVMATLPGRYRSLIWLRKGGYCVATLPFPAREAVEREGELREATAPISQVLSDLHVRQLVERGDWPGEFVGEAERVCPARGGERGEKGEGAEGKEGEEVNEQDDGRGDAPNRVEVVIDESSSSEMYY